MQWAREIVNNLLLFKDYFLFIVISFRELRIYGKTFRVMEKVVMGG